MKKSASKLIALVALLGISNFASAQYQTYLDGLTKDFNKYMDSYADPLLQGLGYGFNNGWYNTGRPHKTFGFDLTISGNLAYVPVANQSFNLNPDDYNQIDLVDPNNDEFPTIMGGTSLNSLKTVYDKSTPGSPEGEFPVLDGIKDDLPFKKVAVPSPIVQVGIGIVKSTELKIRWIPNIPVGTGVEYKYWGLGVMHSISQWIPVVKSMPFLDISGFVGFTTIDVTYDMTGNTYDGTDQMAEFGVNTFTYQVVASASVSVITGFVGIGYDNFKTNLGLKGTYDVTIPGTGGLVTAPVVDPVSLDAKGGGFRATAGARLKLAILTFHGAYTFQGFNTFNAGIGFSFR